MKYLLLCFCLALWAPLLYSQPAIDSLLAKLHQAIKDAPSFDNAKQARIDTLRHSLTLVDNNDASRKFAIYKNIYEEYKLFTYDSAYTYAKKLEETAHALNDPTAISFARLKISFCLLSAGMFKETAEIIEPLKVTDLPDSSKAEYYSMMARYHFDLADFDNDSHHTPGYTVKGNKYLDSALTLLNPGSFNYIYFSGWKQLKVSKLDSATISFNKILGWGTLTDHQLALAASTASDVYMRRGQTNETMALLIKAAIGDIRSSTKETLASFNLANLLYKKGDLKNASVCIELAMKEADFYGARQRKVRLSDVLPLIEGERLNEAENQKRIWATYAVLVTLLLVAVIVSVSVILKQIKKLKAAQRIITEAHNKEQEINFRLAETNNKLIEANKIKEEYLGYFFNVNSEFFDKIERFKNSLEQKITERKTDDIKFLVNNINLRKEKEYLVQNFDKVFLKLFPNFIAEFNSLFAEENRVMLKEDELLNTDLRIFALIRMGIHDNEKIARILQYSVNTINTYKTKVKNRSLVSNEEFEKRIMEIKSI